MVFVKRKYELPEQLCAIRSEPFFHTVDIASSHIFTAMGSNSWKILLTGSHFQNISPGHDKLPRYSASLRSAIVLEDLSDSINADYSIVLFHMAQIPIVLCRGLDGK